MALPQVLLSALRGEIQAIVSVPLPLDYESVLTRPHQLEATGLSIAEANAILDALTGVAEPCTCDSSGGRDWRIRRTRWFWRQP